MYSDLYRYHQAKEVLVLAGTRKAIHYVIRNVTIQKMNTLLRGIIGRICQGISSPAETCREPFSCWYILHDEKTSALLKATETPALYKVSGRLFNDCKKGVLHDLFYQ